MLNFVVVIFILLQRDEWGMPLTHDYFGLWLAMVGAVVLLVWQGVDLVREATDALIKG